MPGGLVRPLALALPLAELAVALALLSPASAGWGAAAALLLLVLFIAAVGFNLVRGRRPECHCFGRLRSEPVGARTILRNLALVGAAGLVAWVHLPAQPEPVLWLLAAPQHSLTVAGAAILGLALAGGWLGLGQPRRASQTSQATAATAATDGATPIVALEPGEPAPALELPNLAGGTVRLADFRGSPILVLFWNPGCGACQQMLPSLREWEDDAPPGAPRLLLVVPAGSVGTGQALGLRSTVAVDTGSSTARAFGASGTPTAVLVDAEGQVGSAVIRGGAAILAIAGWPRPAEAESAAGKDLPEAAQLAPAEGVTTAELDADLVVYDGVTTKGYVLNGTAAYIWESFDGSRTVEGVARDVAEDFAIAFDLALADVREVASRLHRWGLLVRNAPVSADPVDAA